MQTTFNKNPQLILDDVNHNLLDIKSANDTLQLDFSRNEYIYSYCEKVEEKLRITIGLINRINFAMPFVIATETNRLFKDDENLSKVLIEILNTKRTYNSCSAFLKLGV
ncbi:hypothetical protein [uncultured Flavobacterium sp.]|uniref:hypothetical protein n=1 Tax=uncultured Flavobacterium sp. TaxID=165435 RepID=UPI0030EB1987|tara:strand:+ start:500 stop:826 length:327 start_codon:yes stop_codon:yes gene_type:complete